MNGTQTTQGTPSLRGFALAITTCSGPVQLGYLGKVATDHGDGSYTLTEAIQFESMVGVQNGRMIRKFGGSPILFTHSLQSLRVRPMAFIPLDDLSEEDAKGFNGVLDEAKTLRDGLAPGIPIIGLHKPGDMPKGGGGGPRQA